MCDVLLNAAFNFMRDLIFANSTSHKIKVKVKISRYTVFCSCKCVLQKSGSGQVNRLNICSRGQCINLPIEINIKRLLLLLCKLDIEQ